MLLNLKLQNTANWIVTPTCSTDKFSHKLLSSFCFSKKMFFLSCATWCTAVISVTQKAKAGGLQVQDLPR